MLTSRLRAVCSLGLIAALGAFWGHRQLSAAASALPVVAAVAPAWVQPAVQPESAASKIGDVQLGAASLPIVARPRLDDTAFAEHFRGSPQQLGSLSLGRPNRGNLFNPVELLDSPELRVVTREHAFATEETISALTAAVHQVNVQFSGTPVLAIGDLSDSDGGWISPHRSHQSGRDVDVGVYYADDSKWYSKATPSNLDAPRTWAFIAALYETKMLEYVFFDRSLHPALRAAAEQAAAPAAVIECVFEGCPKDVGPLLRHAWGHRTHLHVRFSSPNAVESAGRAQALAGKAGQRAGSLLVLLKRHAHAGTSDARPAGLAARPAARKRATSVAGGHGHRAPAVGASARGRKPR